MISHPTINKLIKLVYTGLILTGVLSQPALANRQRQITVQNKCNSTITIYINYVATNGSRYTTGPWLIDPYDTNYIPNVRTINGTIYYRASNRTHEWSDTRYYMQIGGVSYYAKRFTDNSGSVDLSLSCP